MFDTNVQMIKGKDNFHSNVYIAKIIEKQNFKL